MPTLNRLEGPAITDPVNYKLQLPPYRYFELDNGVPVYGIHAGTQEVLQIEWVFDAGIWHADKKLTAAATNFMLKNGTSKKDAFYINKQVEFFGAFLSVQCHVDFASVILFCLNKNAGELVPIIAELLTDSVFPENELMTFKQIQRQKLKVNLQKCDFVANRLIDQYLYGEKHPYGAITTFEDYENLQRDHLLQFFKTYYQQGKCRIFVAGLLPGNLEQLLNNHFGSLPLNKKTLPDKSYDKHPATEKKHQITNDANGVQAAIRLARPFPGKHHPDFKKAMVLNNILGGFFGSRLMSNIREEKGYTYGIYSHFKNYRDESEWMISTEAGRTVGDATIQEIYVELDKLKKEPVPEDELYLVRNQMMGGLLSRLDGPFEIIARWKSYILNNLDAKYFYDSVETIKTVSADDLQELANTYFTPDSFYELTVI